MSRDASRDASVAGAGEALRAEGLGAGGRTELSGGVHADGRKAETGCLKNLEGGDGMFLLYRKKRKVFQDIARYSKVIDHKRLNLRKSQGFVKVIGYEGPWRCSPFQPTFKGFINDCLKCEMAPL